MRREIPGDRWLGGTDRWIQFTIAIHDWDQIHARTLAGGAAVSVVLSTGCSRRDWAGGINCGRLTERWPGHMSSPVCTSKRLPTI